MRNEYAVVGVRGRVLWQGNYLPEAISHHQTMQDNGIRCSLVHNETAEAQAARVLALYGY